MKMICVLSIDVVNIVLELYGLMGILFENYYLTKSFALMMTLVTTASIASAVMFPLYWLNFALNVIVTVLGFDLARFLKAICFPVEIQMVNYVTDIPGQIPSKK